MSSNQFKNISISGGIGIKGKETLSHDPVITYQYITNVEPETTGIFGKSFADQEIFFAFRKMIMSKFTHKRERTFPKL